MLFRGLRIFSWVCLIRELLEFEIFAMLLGRRAEEEDHEKT